MSKRGQKEEIFCCEFVKTGNAAEAYRRAGYKAKNERVAISGGSRLLTRVDVKARIKELSQKAETETIVDMRERREILSRIARNGKHNDAIRAVDTMNKMDGVYIQRTEITNASAMAPKVVVNFGDN